MSDSQLSRSIKQNFTASRILFNNTDVTKPARINEDSQMINGQLMLLIPNLEDRLQSYLHMALSQSQMKRQDDEWED